MSRGRAVLLRAPRHDESSLVLLDEATHYDEAGLEPYVYRPHDLSYEEARTITEISLTERVRPAKVSVRRYDYERPTARLRSQAGDESDAALGEDFFEVAAQTSHEEHTARFRLEASRRDAAEGQALGQGAPVVGACYAIEDSPVHEGRADVVVVGHRYEYRDGSGESATEPHHRARFRFVPATTPYRMRCRSLRRRRSIRLASVVGPPGIPIYTDALGRVKVRFHAEGRDGSGWDGVEQSCWVRVCHPLAGAGWGTQFVPRVGMEVVVGFLAEDDDEPVVLGCVSHKGTPHPFPLPESRSWIGLRSQTLKGGASTGYSEISIDDSSESSQVRVSAESRLLQESKLDTEISVGRSHSMSVGASQSLVVAGDSTASYGADLVVGVSGRLRHDIKSDVFLTTAGSQHIDVGGVATTKALEQFTTVARDARSSVGGDYSLQVGENAGATLEIASRGQAQVMAGEGLILSAQRSLTLACGETTVTLTRDGLMVNGRKLNLHAIEHATMTGAGAGLRLSGGAVLAGGSVVAASSGASLVLDANASLDGALVLLNCGGQSAGVGAEDAKTETTPLRLRVLRPDGTAAGAAEYELVVGSSVLKGTTSATGMVDELVPAASTTAHLQVWPDGREAPRLRWTLALKSLEGTGTLVGVASRLQNLGFYSGPLVEELTPLLRAALAAFQLVHALEPTGEPDAETLSQLEAVHGS
ncbi:MAG: type VI secretion system tip protein TssI/VgrG [Polyangiaceae bacterium]